MEERCSPPKAAEKRSPRVPRHVTTKMPKKRVSCILRECSLGIKQKPKKSTQPVVMENTQVLVQHVGDILRRQMAIRNHFAEPLVSFLRTFLVRETGCICSFRLYGSLHHGLFVEEQSKINLDISFLSGDKALRNHILCILASILQQRDKVPPQLQYPVLIQQKTTERPLILVFLWGKIAVHVTVDNHAGVETSNLLAQGLMANPLLRLILMIYKERLRKHTQLLGSNVGQVSTYAMFNILLSHVPRLGLKKSIEELEQEVRMVLINYLRYVPRLLRTKDPLNPEIDLTARSYKAQELAKFLSNM